MSRDISQICMGRLVSRQVAVNGGNLVRLNGGQTERRNLRLDLEKLPEDMECPSWAKPNRILASVILNCDHIISFRRRRTRADKERRTMPSIQLFGIGNG